MLMYIQIKVRLEENALQAGTIIIGFSLPATFLKI
jgi:hypothetical protein